MRKPTDDWLSPAQHHWMSTRSFGKPCRTLAAFESHRGHQKPQVHDSPIVRSWMEGGLRQSDLVGAAQLQLVSGVVQLRPEDARRCCGAGGPNRLRVAFREDSIAAREQLMRRFGAFANEFSWNWEPSHVG
jgi:hypothetical protein